MSLDPYAPPEWQENPPEPKAPLREIVLGWEKLRLIYNGILALPGLGVLAVAVLQEKMPLWFALTGGAGMAIGANVCFFLGPVAELYLRALLFRGDSFKRARMVFFILGVVISLIVFAAALFFIRLPSMLTGD